MTIKTALLAFGMMLGMIGAVTPAEAQRHDGRPGYSRGYHRPAPRRWRPAPRRHWNARAHRNDRRYRNVRRADRGYYRDHRR